MVEKLVPDPFIKNQYWAYLWINSLNVIIPFVFTACTSRRVPKYIKTKLMTIYFYYFYLI